LLYRLIPAILNLRKNSGKSNKKSTEACRYRRDPRVTSSVYNDRGEAGQYNVLHELMNKLHHITEGQKEENVIRYEDLDRKSGSSGY
jgi:hypothetical protein